LKILQVPEAKKIVQSYLDGYIRVKELRAEIEQYWNMKTHRGTKGPVVEWKVFSVPLTLNQDR
jgi:hypothetical protein